MQKNEILRKSPLKLSKMKFFVMRVANQKLRFARFTVGNLLNGI